MRFDRSNLSANRRTFMKMAGVAAGSSALSGAASAMEMQFDRTVDIVEEGADNSGNKPIDDVLNSVKEDNTLVQFPNGTYRIDKVSLYGLSNFGLRAVGDDVTLVPGTQSDLWLGGGDMQNFLFEGFTIDNKKEGIHPKITFGVKDGLVFRDVEKVGVHDGKNEAFGFRILSSDGTGLVENVRATDGGDEAAGMYVDSKGTLTVRNCRIEGFGDNGLYASSSAGPVQVEGGTYKNNDISQVRLGSDGSYVRGATISVDEPPEEHLNARGVRVSDSSDGGVVTIDDCDIILHKGIGGGGVVCAFDGAGFHLKNTRIEVGSDYTAVGSGGSRTGHAVLADSPNISNTSECRVENTSITGSGKNYSAIGFRQRSSTAVSNACIQQDGSNRDGIVYESCGDNVVKNCTINVTGDAIVESSCQVSASGIQKSGSCPTPSASESTGEPGKSSSTTTSGSSGENSTTTGTSTSTSSESTSTSNESTSNESTSTSNESTSTESTSTETSTDSTATETSTASTSTETSNESASTETATASNESTESSDGSSTSASSSSSGSVDSLADAPVPKNAAGSGYAVMGTDESSPTLVVYGNFRCPFTRDFAFDNLQTLLQEFVAPGDLNVEFRAVAFNLKDPSKPYISSDGDTLSALALGTWRTDPSSYWSLFEYLFAQQSSVEWQSVSDSKTLLQNQDVSNAASVANLAHSDELTSDLKASVKEAANAGVYFVPTLVMEGETMPGNAGRDQVVNWVESKV